MADDKKDNILRRQIDHLELRATDEERRMVEFVASTGAVDTYGTVLPPDMWDLARYARNGVVGYQHDIYYSDDPDNVIGRGEAYTAGGELLIRIFFEPAELNPKADKVYRKVLFGSINAVSVGFRATAPGHWGRKADGEDPDVYYYNGQELMEVSVVNVPSNPDAVKRSAAEELARYERVPEVEETKQPEEEVKASEPDDTNIRLTLARAKRQLAKN
jgi:HK97 family phage prohead protease